MDVYTSRSALTKRKLMHLKMSQKKPAKMKETEERTRGREDASRKSNICLIKVLEKENGPKQNLER